MSITSSSRMITRSRAFQLANGYAQIPLLKNRCFLCDQSPTERKHAMPARKTVSGAKSRSRRPKRLAVLVDPCPGTTNLLRNNANRPKSKSTLIEKSLSSTSLRLTEGVVTRSRAKLLAGGSPEIARRKSCCIQCDQSPTECEHAMPARKTVSGAKSRPGRPKNLDVVIETSPVTTNLLSNNANRPKSKSTFIEKSLSSTSLRLTEGVVTRSRAKLLAGESPEIARRKSCCIPCDQSPTERRNAMPARKKVAEGKSWCPKTLAVMIEKCLGISDLLNNKATWPKQASIIPEESGPADTFASLVKEMAYEDSPLSPVSMESLRWVSDDEFE